MAFIPFNVKHRVGDFEHEKGYIPNVGQFIEADTFLLNIANNVLKKQGNLNFYRGNIASGDIFCTETKMSNKIKEIPLSYPRIISDSWDYPDILGIELMELAEIYKRI